MGLFKEVGFPELGGVKMDAFWPFWPLDRTGEALWIGVDLDKMEGGAERSRKSSTGDRYLINLI